MAKLDVSRRRGSVTGSKYLVEAAGKRLLIDCGIFQGLRELTERNFQPLSVDPTKSDYLALNARASRPYRLAARAGEGRIQWTDLRQSRHHRPDHAAAEGLRAFAGRGRAARAETPDNHAPENEPMYTSEDVDPVLRLMKPAPRIGDSTSARSSASPTMMPGIFLAPAASN